jgi:hypothetical protein
VKKNMTFRNWLMEQMKLRYNDKHVATAKMLIADTCCKAVSYDHIVVHMMNEHALTPDQADILYHAATRWANAAGPGHIIEHPYELV